MATEDNPIFKILKALKEEDKNCRKITTRQTTLEDFGFVSYSILNRQTRLDEFLLEKEEDR